MTQLPAEAQRLIDEEEAVLARVLATLKASARSVGAVRDTSALQEQLRVLRDEASTATASDLPRLFQEMNSLRALLERKESIAVPSLSTPYFAHLRVHTDGQQRDYLLGRATFADTSADVRIVDWRYAPIAGLFYSYQEGDDYEEMLPGGMSVGVIEARRVVVIERGVLTRIMAGARILARAADGSWAEEGGAGATTVLSGGTGTAARAGSLGVGIGAAHRTRADVTALLDREQFDAVSVSADEPLLVLGSAGSGKTTVALHRLARLAFDNQQRFPQGRLRVVVPEEGLMRLSQRLLAPLGLDRVRVETLPRWVYRSACAAFGVPNIKLASETPALVSRLKSHPALRDVLLKAIGKRPLATGSLSRLKRQMSELFTDRAFLGEVVAAAQGDLPTTAIENTVRHTMQQLSTPLAQELAVTDSSRLQTIDGRSLEEGTPEELFDTSDVEDLSLYLYLKARGGGFHAEDVSHLVLDEAEDFSLFELFVLGKQLGSKRSCTVAGDEMQQTNSSFAGWPESLRTMGVANASTVRLQVSYRCPRPVVEIAQHVLGTQAPVDAAKSGRAGAPVGMHRFPDEAQAHLFLAAALRDLVDREPNASIGVVAGDSTVARNVYQSLASLPNTRLVLNGQFTFEPGIDVADVTSVKGLEFDYVIIPDATGSAYPLNDESRRRLHVAVTRASHQLWLISAGSRTPLLEGFVPQPAQ